jgi:uncharacterized surface protein with fasciclin (FAS1) repeats
MRWILILSALLYSAGSVSAADDLLAVAQKSGRCRTFLKALQLAGLTSTMKDYGALTVFAPTDEGFSKLPKDVFDELVKPANKPELAIILLAHIVKGKMMAADLRTMTANTLGDSKIHVSRDGDAVMYGDANLVRIDLVASNGVLHLIDKVVLPEQKEPRTENKQPRAGAQSGKKNPQ